MNENPYSSLIGMMKKQGGSDRPPSIKIAEVVVGGKDLQIQVDDLYVDKANIYISDFLLSGHKRTIKTDPISDIDGSTNTVNDGGGSSSHNHKITGLTINESTMYTVDGLKAKDLVAVMPVANKQSYIVLSRVVRI